MARRIALGPIECGTEAGYRRHLRRKEPTCEACKLAHALCNQDYYGRNPDRRWSRMNPDASRRRTREWQRKNRLRYREEKRQQAMRARHGIDAEAVFASFWESQGGQCYLCGCALDAKTAHIDHDHRCCPSNKTCPSCRRGLACPGCNAAVGHASDDPERLRRIAENLAVARDAAALRIAAKQEQMELFGA